MISSASILSSSANLKILFLSATQFCTPRISRGVTPPLCLLPYLSHFQTPYWNSTLSPTIRSHPLVWRKPHPLPLGLHCRKVALLLAAQNHRQLLRSRALQIGVCSIP